LTRRSDSHGADDVVLSNDDGRAGKALDRFAIALIIIGVLFAAYAVYGFVVGAP
jgi:hypothetical protein